MADEFNLNLADFLSYKEIREICEGMGELQLEEANKNNCEQQNLLSDVVAPSSQQIPVWTTPRSLVEETRPYLDLVRPYSTDTYRAKIRSRSVLQGPTQLLLDPPTSSLQQSQPRSQNELVNHYVQDPPRVRSYSTGSANQSVRLSSRHQNRTSITEQYPHQSYRSRLHSSAASSVSSPSLKAPKNSSRVNSSHLPARQDLVNKLVPGLSQNCSYSTTSTNSRVPLSQHSFPQTKSSHKTVQLQTNKLSYNSDLSYQNIQAPHYQFQNNSLLLNQKAQFPYYGVQNNSVSPNSTVNPNSGPYNSISDDWKRVQTLYNSSPCNNTIPNEYYPLPKNTPRSQNMSAQVPNCQSQLNYPSTTAGQAFPRQFSSDSFQNFPNSSVPFTNIDQFQYGSSLANQRVTDLQYPFENNSRSANQSAQLPFYGLQNNSELFNNSFKPTAELSNYPNSVQPPDQNFQFQIPRVPYNNSASYREAIRNDFLQVQNNTLSSDFNVPFPSSQWPHENRASAYGNQTDQSFPNTSSRRSVRNRSTQRFCGVSLPTNECSS